MPSNRLSRSASPAYQECCVQHTDEYNATVANEDLRLWNETRTGLLAEIAAAQWGFLRLPDDSPVWNAYPDPAAGPNTAHFELAFSVS